jgi:hypothetical protein
LPPQVTLLLLILRSAKRVSKDGATSRASWFETALARLLTMRGESYARGLRLSSIHLAAASDPAAPHPEERGTRVSKDVATGRASWFETALARLLTMRHNRYPLGRLS